MITVFNLFILLIQLVALVTALAAIVLFIIRTELPEEMMFFTTQVGSCRFVTFLCLILGWLLNPPGAAEAFAFMYMVISVFWFTLGVLYLILLVVGIFRKSQKEMLNLMRKYGTGCVYYGVFMYVAAWFLLG
jgi:hypothetical protein